MSLEEAIEIINSTHAFELNDVRILRHRNYEHNRMAGLYNRVDKAGNFELVEGRWFLSDEDREEWIRYRINLLINPTMLKLTTSDSETINIQ